MSRGWRPLVVGAAVVVATFALAQAQVFAPSAPAEPGATGDAARGESIFAGEVRELPRRRRDRRCRPGARRYGPRRSGRLGRRAAGPRRHARRHRLRPGAGRRRRLRRLDLDAVQLGSRGGGRGTDRPAATGGDVRHRARDGGLRGRRPRLADARGRHGLRRGGAGRPLRRVGRVGAAVRGRPRQGRRRRPVRARGHRRAPGVDRGRAGGEGCARRGAPRPPGKAARHLRAQAARPAPSRPTDLVDGLARGSRRHGASRREGRRRRFGDSSSSSEAETASTSSASEPCERPRICR